MKFPTSIPTRFACPVAALLIAQGANAELASEIHPQGLFYTPQAGLDAPIRQVPSDAVGLKEHFQLSGGVSVRYDSNVNNENTGEQDDIITSISATLRYQSAAQGAAENTFSVAYSPSYSIYASNSSDNNLGHALSLSLGKELPKTSIGFSLSYSKTNGSNRFVSGQIDHGSLSANLNINHVLTGKTSLNLGFGYSFDDFGSGALFDNNSYSASLGIQYQATGKISVGPYINYSFADVRHGGGSRDQDVWGYGVRATYEVSGKTAITASIGQSGLTFSESNGGDDTITWRIGVSHTLSAKTNIRASFYRSYKASYTFEDAAYVATGVAISASHAYSERLSLFATFTYENDDYLRADDGGYNLVSDYYSVTVGGRYTVNERLSLGANLTYSANEDTFGENEYDKYSVGISANYTFW